MGGGYCKGELRKFSLLQSTDRVRLVGFTLAGEIAKSRWSFSRS